MITQDINSWRDYKNIAQVKGISIPEKNKPKLFESGINYILTSGLSMSELVNEVLGFTNTRCEAFQKLSIDNSFFFYEAITRDITYLICLCFIKDNYIDSPVIHTPIIPSQLADWLTNLSLRHIIPKLNGKYIEHVKITDDKIIFGNNYPQIKLLKLNRKLNTLFQFRYTNKTKQINLEKLYSNHDGKCLGATNYWLNTIAISYQLVSHSRQQIKSQYIKSLVVKTIEFVSLTVRYIEDQKTMLTIVNLHSTFNINSRFKFIQHIYSTSLKITQGLLKLIQILLINQLPELYVQILSNDHAMGIALVVKGTLVKILAYDPNSFRSYVSITVDPKSIPRRLIHQLFHNMPYLLEEKMNNIPLVMKCYAYNTSHSQFKVVENNLDCLGDDLKRVLFLGIGTDCEDMVLKALNGSASESEKALTQAVSSSNTFTSFKIINLLVQCLPQSINYVDDRKYTALCYAVAKHNIEVIKLLLNVGAIVEVPGAISPIELAKSDYKDEVIYNILMKHNSLICKETKPKAGHMAELLTLCSL
jgi:hypothetical protein